VRARCARQGGAAVPAFEPVPVLAEPGVAVSRRLRSEAERRAAVGPGRKQLTLDPLAARSLLAEQREGELIARIEQRNRVLALARAIRNSPPFPRLGGVL